LTHSAANKHAHEALVHNHRHSHDEHHQHTHDFPWDGKEHRTRIRMCTSRSSTATRTIRASIIATNIRDGIRRDDRQAMHVRLAT
jgi:hypothetical protein